MSYVTLTHMQALFPKSTLIEALDEDRDGQVDADVWAQVAEAADNICDGYLASRFDVPLDSPPALVIEAAKVFAAEIIFSRRMVSADQNPYTAKANSMRKILESIARGNLDLTTDTAIEPVAVTDTAKTTSALGNMAF